jgi:hypothetical protein
VKSYRAGTSIKALSRQFQLHQQTVRAHLERAAVELWPQQVLTAGQVDEIAELYRAGASLRELGLQYNVANNIRNYLLRAGVPTAACPAVASSASRLLSSAFRSFGTSGRGRTVASAGSLGDARAAAATAPIAPNPTTTATTAPPPAMCTATPR